MYCLRSHFWTTPQQCSHSRQQLRKVKGFAQIVVGPSVEPLHPVLDRVTGGKHQHRHRRTASSQVLADLDSVAPRQHYIQNDEVVIVDAGLVECGLSVARDVDSIGVFAKSFRENLGCIGLVFHQQYPHESSQAQLFARINPDDVSRRHLNGK